MATSQDINSLFQSTLGRSADKSGLDYYTKMANEKGIDWVQNSLSGSDEAQIYKQRGSAFTVAKGDQAEGLNYRNNANVATTQAKDANDYGLLSSAMQKGVEQGSFTTVQGDNGQTLYRSQTGGLYDITGAPAQQRSAPQSTVTPQQTSQYQLQQMLSSDSPLMKLSATQGQQQAAQRGLLNSSMAGQAAQGAMISAATPFAQQDAQTYFQNSQANTDRQQQAFMSDLQYQQQRGLNQQGFNFDTQKLAQQFTNDSQLSEQEANQSLNNLYATSTANAWGVMANNLTDLVGQSASAIQQIQMNADIAPESKATMIQQVLDMRNTDIQFQQDLYANLGTYLANTGVFPNLS
ncbi:hypothetical protein [Halomonas sp. WWR20]